MKLEKGVRNLRILFVCTGNTCRSPLAELMLRAMAQQAGLDIEVRSAGVSASDGSPISANSAQILQEKGIPTSSSSKPVTGQLADWADLILTMSLQHKSRVIHQFPQTVDKIYTLKEFAEDNPDVAAGTEEWAEMNAQLQMKLALSQEIDPAEWVKLHELEQHLPSVDISDPFGSSLEVYRHTALEIETYLLKLLQKLTNKPPDDPPVEG